MLNDEPVAGLSTKFLLARHYA